VIEGVTGVTVDGTSINEVSQAVIAMFDNPQESRAMGEAGRNWIHDKWRWEIWAAEFNALFK
jgi:phosphatidylinositol alpha-1,6-mannosyltransferase